MKTFRIKLKHQLPFWPPHLTSLPDFTNALIAEWSNAQTQSLVASLPRRVEVIITVRETKSGMR